VSDPRSLSASDAAQLSQAFTLLQRGRARDAQALATSILRRVPKSPDALHLLALCSKALGDSAGAVAAFDAALALAPEHASLLANYANFLGAAQRLPEALALYERALGAAPGQADHWMNYGLALLRAGDAAKAVAALERAVGLSPAVSTMWQALGSARRGARDLDGAETALRRAVELNAGNGAAWISLGVVRRLQGDPHDALTCYEQARKAGFKGPELDDAEASAHLDSGRPEQAVQIARRLTAAAPNYAPGHGMLARLLWEHGAALAPGEEPGAMLRTAVAQQPDNDALRLEFSRFLLDARVAAEAIGQLQVLRTSSDGPALVVLQARALELLDDRKGIQQLFDSTYSRMSEDSQYMNMYVRHLLRTGAADLAAQRSFELLQREPFNQLALAQLGIAWRLSGDARESWLCDYERFVCDLSLELQPSFLEHLQSTLAALHTAQREPVDQSLRGGTQTAGVLFGRREPVIRALRDACASAIAGYVSALPDDEQHPFLRRKSPRTRFTGSWSVRLRSSGRHANHFHQEGWISSAFYVQLPPTMLDEKDGRADGWIQFGAPPEELGLNLPPRRLVQPRVGRLVLFPSYFWHGTVPFEDTMPRLTVAFDAVPA
jgi:tetratricopeptide (TPR) repeat protein